MKGVLALIALLTVSAGGGVAWWESRDRQGTAVAHVEATPSSSPAATADEAAQSPDGESTQPESAASAEPTAVSPTPVEPAGPRLKQLSDEHGDSSFQNEGATFVSSADIEDLLVVGPEGDKPGWLIVQLAQQSPGVGVVVRIDTNGDRLPDLVAWRHTASGTSASYRIDGWSHGSDVLERRGERDGHFSAAGQPAPYQGVAFALSFLPGELAADRLRFNVQTISADRNYDYFPQRHRWQHVAFLAVQ